MGAIGLSDIRYEDLLGSMQHFALAVAKPALGIPVGKAFDHQRDLIEIAAFQPLHVLLIPVIPVGLQFHLKIGDLGQDSITGFPCKNRTDTNLLTVVSGNEDQHPSNGQTETIVIPLDVVDLACHDLVYDPGTVHGMDDLISDPVH